MKKKLWFFVGALIILIIFSPVIYSDEIKTRIQEVPDKEQVTLEYVSDEILIKFKKGILPAKVEEIFSEFNVTKISKIEKLEVHRLNIPEGTNVSEVIERFEKNPFVEFAEPNYYVYTSFVPNDFFYPLQWHFDNPVFGGINMESAWDITTGDSSVVVAVIDTGVAYESISGPGFWHLDTYNAFGGSGSSWWLGVSSVLPSWTALYGSNPTPPGYGNGWKQYLQHSFDLTSATGTVTFSYFYKHDIERNFDFFYVEVSDNNGRSWIVLKTYTNEIGPPNGKDVDWTQDSVDLTSYKGKDVLIRFRFNSDETFSDEDGDFNSNGAVYIDEINISHDSGIIYYDNFNDGLADSWQTTEFIQAPDLAGTSFVAGFDFVNNDNHPNDDNAHGTHVTGTIAQTTNNNLGVAGIAFSTSIMPVKVLNAAGTGTSDMVANGIIFATDNGADIISMSLGSSGPSSVIESAVNYSFNNNVTVIAACGNSGLGSGCDYPAAFTNVISVGATQYDETKAPYSSFGPNLDLVAPGGNNRVDQNSDGFADGVLQNTFGNTTVEFAYWFYQGTSMATPHVAGVAALLLALDSTLTPVQIKNILTTTADDLGASGRDDTFGYGLLNAFAAVNSIAPVGEFISITIYGYPIDFASQDPNTINNPGIGNSYIVSIDSETTVNIDLYQKGNDFIGNPSTLRIGNMSWLDSNNAVSSFTMSNNYEDNILDISSGTNVSVYYWLDIPQSQTGGSYDTTISIKAVKTGTSP